MDTFKISKFNKDCKIIWNIYLPGQNSSVQSPVFSLCYEKHQLELTRRDIGNSKEWWEFLLLKTMRTDNTTEYSVDIYVTEKRKKRTCISNWIMSLETFDDRCPITNPCRFSTSADDSKALPKGKVEFLFVFSELKDFNSERQKCNYPLGKILAFLVLICHSNIKHSWIFFIYIASIRWLILQMLKLRSIKSFKIYNFLSSPIF